MNTQLQMFDLVRLNQVLDTLVQLRQLYTVHKCSKTSSQNYVQLIFRTFSGLLAPPPCHRK